MRLPYWDSFDALGVPLWARLNPLLWVRTHQAKRRFEKYLESGGTEVEDEVADFGGLRLLNAIKERRAGKNDPKHQKVLDDFIKAKEGDSNE